MKTCSRPERSCASSSKNGSTHASRRARSPIRKRAPRSPLRFAAPANLESGDPGPADVADAEPESQDEQERPSPSVTAPSQETLAVLVEVAGAAPSEIAKRFARSSGRTAVLGSCACSRPTNRSDLSSGRTALLASCACCPTAKRSDLSSGLIETICMLLGPGSGLAAAGATNTANEIPIARRRSHRLLRFVMVLLPITVKPPCLDSPDGPGRRFLPFRRESA